MMFSHDCCWKSGSLKYFEILRQWSSLKAEVRSKPFCTFLILRSKCSRNVSDNTEMTNTGDRHCSECLFC